jgi:hypothetical protein
MFDIFDEVVKSLEKVDFFYSGYFDVVDPLNIADFKDEHKFLELKGFIEEHVVFLVKHNLDLFDALAYKDGIYYINEYHPDKIRLQCLKSGQVQEYENSKQKNK